jgi:hypothetical protein
VVGGGDRFGDIGTGLLEGDVALDAAARMRPSPDFSARWNQPLFQPYADRT